MLCEPVVAILPRFFFVACATNQLSNADLDGVTGGVKKPTADPKVGYLTVKMTDVIISS